MIMKVINGNCIEVLKTLEENSVDSVVTDPPYEIGFMGKSWDSSGIANNPEMWKECLRVLKPGGYLLSFSATRTYHRMAVAIEDAGFEVRDMIEWVYGSGFPKSLNIGKAVDKLQGNEREVTGKGKSMSSLGVMHDDEWKSDREYNETKGTSEYIWYMDEPCKILISEVKIVSKEDFKFNKKTRTHENIQHLTKN